MLSASVRSAFRNGAVRRFKSQIRQKHSSTNGGTTILQSRALRAAVIGLAIGVPAGYVAKKSWSPDPFPLPPVIDFQDGSLVWKGQAVKAFTLEDVSKWLRNEESSHQGIPGTGVREWYSVRCPCNSPCEDNLVAAQSPVSGTSEKAWLFWGVFDGHNGWALSTTLRESLVQYVSRSVSQIFQSREPPPPEVIDRAIASAFRRLDDDFISDGEAALKDATTLTEVLSRLALGYAGSCALLSIFDPNSQLLRVACTGDSRAVLGSRDAKSGKYTATALSTDQTGFDPGELDRVRAEHPGEPNVIDVKTGRVLGIAVSRAFGDGLWKWPQEVIDECKDKYFWKPARPGYKTPPYLTAEPVVTTTRIRGEGEFVIMASDGLWDHVSSEDAVKLVDMWLKAKREGTIGKQVRKPQLAGPVFPKPWTEKVNEEDFIVEDENVATHLVRNAFGGANTQVLCGVVGAQPPWARSIRDDVTVQVIFFNDKAL